MSRGRHLHLAAVISIILSSLITLTAPPMQARELHRVAMIHLMLSRLDHPVPH